jgi:hypothetical protein
MEQKDNDSNSIARLMAMSTVQQAEIEVLLFMVEKLMKQQGVFGIEGIPFVDWFQKEKLKQLESILIQIEDKDPASAAYLQAIIDASKRRRGDKEE